MRDGIWILEMSLREIAIINWLMEKGRSLEEALDVMNVMRTNKETLSESLSRHQQINSFEESVIERFMPNCS